MIRVGQLARVASYAAVARAASIRMVAISSNNSSSGSNSIVVKLENALLVLGAQLEHLCYGRRVVIVPGYRFSDPRRTSRIGLSTLFDFSGC